MDSAGKVIPKAIHDHLHAEKPAIREMATNCPSSTAVIELDPLILKAMNDISTGGWHLQGIAGSTVGRRGGQDRRASLINFHHLKHGYPREGL